MSLAIKAERALARYLLGVAPFLIAAPGEFVLTDEGARIRLSSGFEFNFAVLTGQGACEVSGPCLIALCAEAIQDNTQQFTLNHLCQLEARLKFPVDAESNLGTAAELLSCWEYAASQLVLALYRDDLAERLTANEPDFTCLYLPGPRAQTSGFEAEDRLRVFSVLLPAVCTSVFIPQEEPAPTP
jgi:hypothetical protein